LTIYPLDICRRLKKVNYSYLPTSIRNFSLHHTASKKEKRTGSDWLLVIPGEDLYFVLTQMILQLQIIKRRSNSSPREKREANATFSACDLIRMMLRLQMINEHPILALNSQKNSMKARPTYFYMQQLVELRTALNPSRAWKFDSHIIFRQKSTGDILIHGSVEQAPLP